MESWMTVYNWPVLRWPQLAGFEVSPEVSLAPQVVFRSQGSGCLSKLIAQMLAAEQCPGSTYQECCGADQPHTAAPQMHGLVLIGFSLKPRPTTSPITFGSAFTKTAPTWRFMHFDPWEAE